MSQIKRQFRGWGERIRTSELQKLRPSNSMHTPAPSPASRLAMQCPENARRNAEDARKRAGRSGGGRAGGAALTGASGKRIHGAIWHIGEAGAALPTVRLAGASGVGWTPDAPEA